MKPTMMILLAALLAAPAWLGAQTRSSDPPAKIEPQPDNAGKGVKVFTVISAYLGAPSTVEVLLPDTVEKGRVYPTLYVLPVEGRIGGQFGDGLAEVRKTNVHNRYGWICVTMSFDSVPWYGAHASDPHKRHEEYLKTVVVPLVESRFPASAKASDRLLVGFSKSGWGAVSLLLRDPDFWGFACAWDSPLMMTERELKWGSRVHFGTPEQAAGYVPMYLVEKRAAALVGGPDRLIITGSNLFGPDTRKFHELLEQAKVPHQYDKTLKSKHRWDGEWLAPALELLMRAHAATTPATVPGRGAATGSKNP